MYKNLQNICVIFYFVHVNLCHGNYWHYSLTSMYELFDLEIDHIVMTETYIKNEYKRLEDIRSFIQQRELENAKQLEELYTESSINAFKTILRIKNDWETLKNKTTQTTTIGENKRGLVTYDDIISAFKAIRRLQIVYELEVDEIANGKIGSYQFEKLNVDDCFEMARLCYEEAEFHCANLWLDEVIKKYRTENSNSNIDYTLLITLYAEASYLVGDIQKAERILEEYIEANHPWNEALTNMRHIIAAGDKVFKRNTANDRDKKFYSHSLRNLDSSGEVRSFITACQNYWDTSPPHLSCRYYHGGHKFLKIAPLREENIAIVPNVKLYHNMLQDDEIKKIKELAKPQLEKLSTDTNEDISLRKVAIFTKNDDKVLEIIHNRVVQISSKSKYAPSNKYVVTNYGLSGHYLPHAKYIDNDHLINSKGRQAIVIFHMDDVNEGGSTVLPDINVRVPSIKGSALVVHNTRGISTPFGPMYLNAQYGSCPIFYGDKWTLTAWLRD